MHEQTKWWMILAWMWLLQAWKRFCHEQLAKYAWFYVACGWGIPALITSTSIILRKIQSDELTGVCFAGGYSPESVVHWVLIPQFLFVLAGGTLVVLVFACFWRARRLFASQGLPYIQFDVAAARVGVMAILYLVPATCMIGIIFYEVDGREKWRREPGIHPSVEVFMLKIFMSLAPGLLMALFLVNSRVCNAWKNIYKNHFKKKESTAQPATACVLPKNLDFTQLLTMKSDQPTNYFLPKSLAETSI